MAYLTSRKHHKSVKDHDGLSKAAKNFISSKIRKLRHEGVKENVAVAEAFSIARQRGYKVPAKRK